MEEEAESASQEDKSDDDNQWAPVSVLDMEKQGDNSESSDDESLDSDQVTEQEPQESSF